MKVGFLGAGTWAFCLASLLASKGNEVIAWARNPELVERLNRTREHPLLPGHKSPGKLEFTTDMHRVLEGEIELLVESVTSAGLRSVFEQVKKINIPSCPIVITSKGIEQKTGLILSNVLIEVLGEKHKNQITYLSGPSYASEVIQELPTSVVVSGYDTNTALLVCEMFTTPAFRVYPNEDIQGVAYGGALKNIIAIACGIAEGLGMGFGAKATIMTRGLHEIRKLAVANGCQPETLNGLSGMGDLFLTCGSIISRNCRFGHLLAQGLPPKEALQRVGAVVEGAYTCVSALQLGKQFNIPMPITEMVYKIIYEGMAIEDALPSLMERTIKAEHL